MKALTSTSFVILMVTFVVSCDISEKKTVQVQTAGSLLADTTVETSCPFVTKDLNGSPVICFVKHTSDSTALVCIARSSDGGSSFGEVYEIPSSGNVKPNEENMPKVIFKPGGELLCVWGAANNDPRSKYAGKVFYAQSFDDGKSWSDRKALVTDTSSYDQRYFDIALLNNGEAGIIWLDSRKKISAEGSTIYFASTNGKDGFKGEKPFAESICQCCRTELFIDSRGSVHASFRDIINDSIRDMVHVVSVDNGKSFSEPVRISEDNWVISGCPHTGPTMTQNKNGFHYSWYTMGTGEGVFFSSMDQNGKFSPKQHVSNDGSAKHPQIKAMGNEELVIVWDQADKKGEQHYRKIGLQRRNSNGKVLSSEFISGDSLSASFPVLLPLKDDRLLIAYNSKIGRSERIMFTIK